jgi:putative hemolysin
MKNDDTSRLIVRFATNADEIIAAQKLRYRVFVDELGAQASKDNEVAKIDSDEFDPYCKHLLLIDRQSKETGVDLHVVGTIRLLDLIVAEENAGFYSAKEYDLTKIIKSKKKSLEIGRACVEKEYRGTVALHLLWKSLGAYVVSKEITILFGVASFHGKEISKFNSALSLLTHKFSVSKKLNIVALSSGYIDMNIIPLEKLNHEKALLEMPSLIKAYLRLGAKVGEGAYIDTKFNTIDIGIIIEIDIMNDRYKELYGGKKIPKTAQLPIGVN